MLAGRLAALAGFVTGFGGLFVGGKALQIQQPGQFFAVTQVESLVALGSKECKGGCGEGVKGSLFLLRQMRVAFQCFSLSKRLVKAVYGALLMHGSFGVCVLRLFLGRRNGFVIYRRNGFAQFTGTPP